MPSEKVRYLKITRADEFPSWARRDQVTRFFHETMKPYQDSIADIERALDYAFSDAKGEGGFLMLAESDGRLAGALLMLNTGMQGYIPENILLFVTVDPSLRGRGLGGELVQHSIAECMGSVKLHVDYDNPAKRLYERLGFTSKYAEMRLKR